MQTGDHLSRQDVGILVDQAGERRGGLLLICPMAQHHSPLHEALQAHETFTILPSEGLYNSIRPSQSSF